MSKRIVLVHTLTVLHVLIAGVMVVDLLRQHRSQAATISWILVLTLLPYVGLVLYFFGGAPRQRGKQLIPLLRASMAPGDDLCPDVHTPTESLLRALDLPGASRGNELRLCSANVQAAQELFDVIDAARHSLLLSVFSFENDRSGQRIAGALMTAAAAGIEVRVLVDGYGSKELPRPLLRQLRTAGVAITHFRPLWMSALRRGAHNYRNHRKMLVADNDLVWLGGRNLAGKYLTESDDDTHWTDLSLVIRGPAARELACVAANDWFEASGENLLVDIGREHAHAAGGASCVQVLPSGPDLPDDTLHAALLACIMQATTRLWIASPFFVPDDALLAALRLACRRGVDVRVVVPRRSNQWLADQVRMSYLRELQAVGAQIFFFERGMLHAKAIVADDRLAIVGSANFDMRSLFTNHEISVILYSTADVAQVAATLMTYFSRSVRQNLPERFGARLVDGALRIAAPLF